VHVRLHFRERVDSTSERAFAASSAGIAQHGDVFVAREQTAGRGRRGASWHSGPDGGLYVSVVLLPGAPPLPPAALSIAAGLATLETVHELGLARARLKWPNDVVVDRDGGEFAKLAGVLVETRGLDPAAPHYVVGVGLNVEQAAFPAELTASRAVTSLRLEGSVATLENAQERLIARLAQGLERDRLTTDALAGPFLDAARLRDVEVEVETETTLRGRVLGLSLERGLELSVAGRRAFIALEHLRQVRPL
jgi:BirA family biotin operon repressor/biotin-[acetyl-CoA-carboxylase] ligase